VKFKKVVFLQFLRLTSVAIFFFLYQHPFIFEKKNIIDCSARKKKIVCFFLNRRGEFKWGNPVVGFWECGWYRQLEIDEIRHGLLKVR
jgi:hypothetical protein